MTVCVCFSVCELKLNCLCSSVTERDVSRTDRNNTFFSGNDNPGLTLLHDVLMTYCMYNFDLGTFPYVAAAAAKPTQQSIRSSK